MTATHIYKHTSTSYNRQTVHTDTDVHNGQTDRHIQLIQQTDTTTDMDSYDTNTLNRRHRHMGRYTRQLLRRHGFRLTYIRETGGT